MFARELLEFQPYKNNQVFRGGKPDAWDKKIRERGYILKDDGIYKMWYTGFKSDNDDTLYLGYATSKDGIQWERHAGNPVTAGKPFPLSSAFP